MRTGVKSTILTSYGIGLLNFGNILSLNHTCLRHVRQCLLKHRRLSIRLDKCIAKENVIKVTDYRHSPIQMRGKLFEDSICLCSSRKFSFYRSKQVQMGKQQYRNNKVRCLSYRNSGIFFSWKSFRNRCLRYFFERKITNS